jgi:hypothetical protein
MNITLGTTTVSLMDPPNEGTVCDGSKTWKIGRNYKGLIVLRNNTEAHADFLDGMDMIEFCTWINEKGKQ